MKCKEEIKINELVRRDSVVIGEDIIVQEARGLVSRSKQVLVNG